MLNKKRRKNEENDESIRENENRRRYEDRRKSVKEGKEKYYKRDFV
jgi:hypothetical protein